MHTLPNRQSRGPVPVCGDDLATGFQKDERDAGFLLGAGRRALRAFGLKHRLDVSPIVQTLNEVVATWCDARGVSKHSAVDVLNAFEDSMLDSDYPDDLCAIHFDDAGNAHHAILCPVAAATYAGCSDEIIVSAGALPTGRRALRPQAPLS